MLKILSLAVAALCLPSLVAAQEPPPGDVIVGKRVYLANGCQNCHGTVGQGGGPGPVLADTGLPYEAYAGQMRTPQNTMPPYDAALMSDRDLADVYAYLRSLPGPRGPADMPAILKRP